MTNTGIGVDCISREDALMCLTGEFEDRQYEPSELVSIFSQRIKHLPSATPQEPKTGCWYIDERPESNRETICSNCEKPIFAYHKLDFDYRPKYCPNCGAKMESEGEE